jgi:hypothetical protein
VITSREEYLFELQVFFAMDELGTVDFTGDTSDPTFTDAWNNQYWLVTDYEECHGVYNVFIGGLA